MEQICTRRVVYNVGLNLKLFQVIKSRYLLDEEIFPQQIDRATPIFASMFQAFQNQAFHSCTEFLFLQFYIVVKDILLHVVTILSSERILTCEQKMGKHAYSPNVNFVGDTFYLILQLLWRHERESATGDVSQMLSILSPCIARKPKVSQLDVNLLVFDASHENVLDLERTTFRIQEGKS